jgi:glycosyltransferase involved in cell wall biosynthesis
MPNPRVSIITPSYNQAAFLEETIRSVLSQEVPGLEYMIVDGGSTDGSVEIIRRYSSQLAWWISEPDQGQADAVNKGFSRARGDIIGWLNSDDLYQPGAIAAALRVFDDDPNCGMVFGDVVSIDAAGEPINVMTFGDWGLEDLMEFRIISQPGVFFRRSVLEEAGFLDLSYHLLLDHHLWLRMGQLTLMRYLPQRLAAARFHPAAKNLARAAEFGKEAYRLVGWMAGQPGLAQRYRRMQHRIYAGACRIDGRYLLDGGLPREALRAYLRGLRAHPPAVLPEMRRVLFAAASLFVNVDRLKDGYLRRRKSRFKKG